MIDISKLPKVPEMPPELTAKRCANCRYWKQLAITFGECRDPRTVVYVNEAIARHVEKIRLTTDLSVCSGWTGKDGQAA